MLTSAVDLKEVTVQLGGVEVVHNLSVTIGRGEWVALVGPNGAGKTTILRAIAHLVPFAGSIVIDGRDAPRRTRREVALSVALVPQSPQIPGEMTVAEY